MASFKRIGIIIATFVVPTTALAMQSTVWDFSQGVIPGTWNANGIVTGGAAGGLGIQASGEGYMLRETELSHPIDAVRVTVRTDRGAMVALLWHPHDAPPGQIYQFPFQVVGDGAPQTIGINTSAVPDWDRNADIIGLGFLPGTDVVLSQVELSSWSVPEKLASAWTSFWTFDKFYSYSINYLWGPLLAFNPVGVQNLFGQQPPLGWSANRFFYGALIIAAVVLAGLFFWKRRDGKKFLKIFFLVALGVWVVYDVRMGSELVSYAVHDYTTYISQPTGKKVFREYQNMYDMLERSLPELKKEERFGVLAPDGVRLARLAAYMAYPSIPLYDDEDSKDARVWLVFRRPDVSVNASSELVIAGTVIAKGKILERFDDSSFLFRAD